MGRVEKQCVSEMVEKSRKAQWTNGQGVKLQIEQK